MKLECQAQNYDWGKKSDESLVFQLKHNQNKELDKSKRYSELWMGTHPSGPSFCPDLNVPLSNLIDNLPFLFKVLSIEKPLSIQAHPDKELAKKLHAKSPDLYKDDNHKPELAVALTKFEALCGFRRVSEILDLIENYGSELKNLLETDLQNLDQNDKEEENIKKLFTKLMNLPEEEFKDPVIKLTNRIREKENLADIEKLILHVEKYFPGDIGIFCLFFLNYIQLNPGESIFLQANLIHSYISGDCIECMSCSDNVIRAGLTPKYRDCETLCSMANFSSDTIPVITPVSIDTFTKYYPVPISEFLLYSIEITSPPENSEYLVPRKEMSNPLILLVIKGQASLSYSKTEASSDESIVDLSPGSIYFVYPEVSLSIQSKEVSEKDPIVIYYCTYVSE